MTTIAAFVAVLTVGAALGVVLGPLIASGVGFLLGFATKFVLDLSRE